MDKQEDNVEHNHHPSKVIYPFNIVDVVCIEDHKETYVTNHDFIEIFKTISLFSSI